MWVIILADAIIFYHDWSTFSNYINTINFTEPMFVVVIMTLASSRPVLKFTEQITSMVTSLFKGTMIAWWFTIMTMGLILGSFITEPAAMTICAMVASQWQWDMLFMLTNFGWKAICGILIANAPNPAGQSMYMFNFNSKFQVVLHQ